MEITEAQVDDWLITHGYCNKVKKTKKVSQHPMFVRIVRTGVIVETKYFDSIRKVFDSYKDRLSGGSGFTGDHFHNFRSMVNKKADGCPYNIIVLNNYIGDALRVLDTEFITEEEAIKKFGLEVTKKLSENHFFDLRGRGGKILNGKELLLANSKIKLKLAEKLQCHK